MMPRRLTPLTRRLLASALPVAAMALIPVTAGPTTAQADPMIGAVMNRYGLPGIIDTPTAEAMPDATLGASLSWNKLGNRTGLSFQVLPRVSATLRYGKFDSTEEKRGFVRDRSFDVRFLLLDETEGSWQPSVAVGLQDALGTGFYSSEYIVATKTLSPRLRVTAGLGWGRLASAGGIGSPFGERGRPDEGEGGTLNTNQWFRGEVAPFFGVAWKATDKLTLLAEYSGDDYACETGNREKCARSPWVSDAEPLKNHVNLGVNWQAGQNYQIGGYVLGGKHFGIQASMTLNPRQAPYPSGLEKGPAPVRLRPAPAADPDGWSGVWAGDPTAQPAIQKALSDALAKEGQTLESMALTANRAEVRIRNNRYIQQAEAVGRTARLMTRALPPSVETLVVTSVHAGMPTSSVTMRRADIERLENTEAGQIANTAVLTDAVPRPAGLVQSPGIAPRFQWSIKPYASVGLFDPDKPLDAELGAQASASYELMPGLTVSGTLRQRVVGNSKQTAPIEYTADQYRGLSDDQIKAGNKNLMRVRSDSLMYSGYYTPRLTDLTLNWYGRPSETVYTRVTAGLLENMYGGVSAEVLWKPVNSRLALGAEVNRVRKRDYENSFKFRDYEVTTGHVSAYYEFGGGFTGQIDMGRYLAGDVGATATITREFANGWAIGAYATKTNVSAEQFGEGSFDKGIIVRAPLAWAIGTPSKRVVSTDLRSLARDGGQKLQVDGRLYPTVRDSHATKMYDGWGRFWR